jgi:hypothetical protein
MKHVADVIKISSSMSKIFKVDKHNMIYYPYRN